MKRVLNPGPELITEEWLLANCDESVERQDQTISKYDHVVFEIEADEEGGTALHVDVPSKTHHELELGVACELTQWATDFEGDKSIVFLGSFRFLDDLMALLELLGRGHHG